MANRLEPCWHTHTDEIIRRCEDTCDWLYHLVHQCSHTLPRMKFPTISWLDGPHSLPILYEIVWNIFTYREYFKILDTRVHGLFNNLALCVVKYPPFCFWIGLYFPHLRKHEIPYISWLFDPFPNPSWLCQPIPYLFKALKKSDSWLFQDFPYLWEPWCTGYNQSSPTHCTDPPTVTGKSLTRCLLQQKI